jgi:hypothetical protein
MKPVQCDVMLDDYVASVSKSDKDEFDSIGTVRSAVKKYPNHSHAPVTWALQGMSYAACAQKHVAAAAAESVALGQRRRIQSVAVITEHRY